jgi:outer membrane protein OmpA-like peptidoglycan-associated protein
MAKLDSAKADLLVSARVLRRASLIAVLAIAWGASSANAQEPPTPFDQPGAPPPGDQPGAPPPEGPPGGPPPGQFGPPPPDGAPPGTSFGGEVGGDVTFGPPPGPPGGATVAPSSDEDEEARARTLAEQISLTGSTGLLRTAYAGSSEGGMFRVGAMFDWFTAGGFLCSAETPCGAAGTNGDAIEDTASHVGAFFALNATPVSFLEAYAGIRTYANSTDHPSATPQLLQVLGDTTLGVKVFTPFRIANVLTFGGDIRLRLLNAAGDVGVAGGGTSADFFVLTSADLRKIRGKGVGAPLRFHLNLGYMIDNSGVLVEDVEIARADRDPETAGGLARIPISRIERFGLGINRVDFFGIRFGIDAPFDRIVQPYIEYTLEVPVNRQEYDCHTRVISPGDECLALIRDEAGNFSDPAAGGPGYAGIPSRLSLGLRTNPLPGGFRGLSGHLGIDIGLSATSTFIEEVAPQAPWTLWFGLGYAFDVKEKKPVQLPPPPLPPPPIAPPPTEYYVRGTVVEKGTANGIAGAIITVDGSPEPPVATDPGGRFISRKLAPGTFALQITAPGYNPGICTATIAPAAPEPGYPGQPGMPPPGAPPMAPPPQQPTGPIFTDVQCELEALAKAGDVQGSAVSTEGDKLAEVTVEITDANNQTHTQRTSPDGTFGFQDLPVGTAQIKGTHEDYMVHVQQIDVRPREKIQVVLTLNKRPAGRTVRIVGNQILVLKKIHFELNSAVIKGDSFQLLEEIADVLHRNPDIKKVEVQGHTDNTGTAEINRKLSQDRAESVRTWLVDHGIGDDRLVAKGYGATRPLAPNVTPANRERNRRVQFLILERDKEK